MLGSGRLVCFVVDRRLIRQLTALKRLAGILDMTADHFISQGWTTARTALMASANVAAPL
jgi:hypothetical protein